MIRMKVHYIYKTKKEKYSGNVKYGDAEISKCKITEGL